MTVGSELVRGAGTVAVLSLLQRRPMYGYELADTLDQTTDGVLALGHSTLYPLLYNLEAKGLVRSFERSAGSGRRRKYYEPTNEGLAFLSARRKEWTGLVEALRQLGVVTPAVEGGAA